MVLDALAEPRDLEDCARISAEISVALAQACLTHAQARVNTAGRKTPSVACCWFLFGAAARGELLSPTFPGVAAVYRDSDGTSATEVHEYFAAVASAAHEWLSRCGVFPSDSAGNEWWMAHQSALRMETLLRGNNFQAD